MMVGVEFWNNLLRSQLESQPPQLIIKLYLIVLFRYCDWCWSKAQTGKMSYRGSVRVISSQHTIIELGLSYSCFNWRLGKVKKDEPDSHEQKDRGSLKPPCPSRDDHRRCRCVLLAAKGRPRFID